MLSYPEPIYKEIDIYDSTIDNIEMGAVHQYEIDAADSFFTELDSLQIEVTSYLGDVDLEVTLNGLQYYSRSQLPIDQVTLKDYESSFGLSNVLIRVISNQQTHYRLRLMPTYKPYIDSRLKNATPLVDKRPMLLTMIDK